MGDVFLDCFGLNHLTFTKRVFVKGEDVTEEAFKKIKVSISEEDRKILETVKDVSRSRYLKEFTMYS